MAAVPVRRWVICLAPGKAMKDRCAAPAKHDDPPFRPTRHGGRRVRGALVTTDGDYAVSERAKADAARRAADEKEQRAHRAAGTSPHHPAQRSVVGWADALTPRIRQWVAANKLEPIAVPVNCAALFYRDALRGDAVETGFIRGWPTCCKRRACWTMTEVRDAVGRLATPEGRSPPAS